MELEKAKELNYKEILQNEEVKAYLEKGNENLGFLGIPIISKNIVQ